MHALLAYGFLQRAFLAGVLIAVACAVLGIFLILRKDAMIGHGLSHIAFAGVALVLFLNVLPLAAALAVVVAAAIAVMKLKDRAGLHGDTAIGIFSSLGMAVGILLASLAKGFNVELMSYLFGDIMAIEPLEVGLTVALAAAVLLTVRLNYAKLLFMRFDRESARAGRSRRFSARPYGLRPPSPSSPWPRDWAFLSPSTCRLRPRSSFSVFSPSRCSR